MNNININNKIKGVFCALISAGTFGMIPFFSIPLMHDANMNETSILFYRYFFSSIILGFFLLIKRESIRISFNSMIKISIISFMYIITAVGLIYSYNYIPSGVCTTINYLYPIAVVLFMAIFFKEKISKKLILIAIFALIGVGLLSFTEKGSLNLFGLFLAFSTIFTYAIYIVGLNMKGIKELNSTTVSFYSLLFGMIFFAIVAHFTTGINKIPDVQAWLNLSMLALFSTVISIITLVMAVHYIGSTITSILGAVEPLVATIIGVLVFHEDLTIYGIIGFIMIILAVTYVVLSVKRSKN